MFGLIINLCNKSSFFLKKVEKLIRGGEKQGQNFKILLYLMDSNPMIIVFCAVQAARV